MTKKLAIVQSNYIPWKGYFDLINQADEFILLDDVQYTRRDWRNRNKIKTKDGLMWLSIPVNVKGRYFQAIKDVKIIQPKWNVKHWKSITSNYARANYFETYKDFFEDLYLSSTDIYLSQVNYKFIEAICSILGICTKLSWSMDFDLAEEKTERLVGLCKQVNATEYLSGPSAKGYIELDLFRQEGIKVSFIDYFGYPAYHQLFPPFEHQVSILDLIFNEGSDATQYMLSF